MESFSLELRHLLQFPAMAPAPQLVVGTAGHIDHGKSRLVWTLTGTDPDRLPEEKARGMTIDLGFAYSRIEDCDIWFVDVPGHERFVRNMVAGATGIDVALLVVAADDSVMPQTREHAELLSLLGIERCIVVLTKMDLVDEAWADEVEQEVRKLLMPLDIEPWRVVRTSAETGRGFDELKNTLAVLARQQAGSIETTDKSPDKKDLPTRTTVGMAPGLASGTVSDGGTTLGGVAAQPSPHFRVSACTPSWFRLPIDRVFVAPGRGTVVTGSVTHGTVNLEDELELWPEGRRVRVRGLQTHHDQRSAAAGRMRLAVNLAGVSHEEVRRGGELATPGYLQATRRLDVWIAALRMPGKTIRQNIRLRLHIATSEVLAELRLSAKPTELSEGALRGQFAQLKTAEPIAASWGQRFIVRDESGNRTLGGGRVLQPAARLWTAKHPPDFERLKVLLDGAPERRLEEIIRADGWIVAPDAALTARAGLTNAAETAQLREWLVAQKRVQTIEGPAEAAEVHADHLAALKENVLARLAKFLKTNPRLPGVARSEWPGWMPRACPSKLRPALADWLIRNGDVAVVNGFLVPPGRGGPAMTEEDQKLLDALLAEFHAAAFQPPALENLRCRTPRNEKRVQELVKLAMARGQLVRIADGIWLHGQRWTELVERVTNLLRERKQAAVADIRTLLNSSRKYVVPLVEALDAAGITKRVGDLRTLGPKAPL